MGGEAQGALGEGAGEHGSVVVEVWFFKAYVSEFVSVSQSLIFLKVHSCWSSGVSITKAMTSDEFAATAIFGISHVNM